MIIYNVISCQKNPVVNHVQFQGLTNFSFVRGIEIQGSVSHESQRLLYTADGRKLLTRTLYCNDKLIICD